ncbi:unnamed protein product [Closterium sp. NIES-53]
MDHGGEAEQQRLRDLPDPAPARLVRGPLPSPPVPPFGSLSTSSWTRRYPFYRAVSPEPRRSRYREDGPFHLVLRSCVTPPPVLPQPLESYLTKLHDPLSDYLRASCPVIPAEEVEMASYRSTGIYVDTVPPPGANVVNGMWLYKVKRPPRSPPVFKARYVVRGFSQREGVDFFQTFAPTPKMTTLRVLLHIAAWRDYELHSLDFSTAFLQGSLHEQIWLRCPPGFTSSFPPTTQWQLRRLIYGLRQAPRVWHDTLRTTLAVLDFFPLSADPSLFVRRCSTPFFVLVYVDDLVFATPDRCALAFVKEELQRRHTCTSLGELQRYLGLHITKDSAACTITLTQSHMVEQILTRFHFPFSKVQLTLLAVDHGLTAPVSDESFESSGPYPELFRDPSWLRTVWHCSTSLYLGSWGL